MGTAMHTGLVLELHLVAIVPVSPGLNMHNQIWCNHVEPLKMQLEVIVPVSPSLTGDPGDMPSLVFHIRSLTLQCA